MTKVTFCTPTIAGPHPAYIAAMEASVPLLEAAGFDHKIAFEVANPYISGARASLLRKALDAQSDVVVFIDHDVAWDPEDLVILLETEGDVVAGTYRFKDDGDEAYMGTVHTDPENDKPLLRDSDGAIAAKLVPAGFLKVTAEAVDRFMGAYPELCYGKRYAPSVDLFNHGAHGGKWWGEDYAFSRRWAELGGDLWIVPNLNLTHHSPTTAYPGNFLDYFLRRPGGAREGQAPWWETDDARQSIAA